MLSESARMSSAAEARLPDRCAELEAARRQGDRARPGAASASSSSSAQRSWNNATFFTASAFGQAPRRGDSFAGWLSDLAGRTKNLIEEVNSADLVVMVARPAKARSRFDHRRSLQRQARDDHRAGARRRQDFRRGAVKDAVAAPAMGVDAGDRQRRRIHRRHAGGAARMIPKSGNRFRKRSCSNEKLA